MKKYLSILLKKQMPLVCVIFMISGCTSTSLMGIKTTSGGPVGGGIIESIANDIEKAKREKEESRLRLAQFSKGGINPFTNTAEERLTRRTSTLTGGIPIDVSPYLWHENSFAVTEKGIQHYNSILEIAAVFEKETIPPYEFDVYLTFKIDNQDYKMNVTAVSCQDINSPLKIPAKHRVSNYMKQYAAQRLGLDQKNIRNFNVKYLKTIKGKSDLIFQFDNIFVQDIEPGYYQFDVEVEYQKKSNGFNLRFISINKEITPVDFAVFNKVYRSDFTSLAAAVIDVQAQILKDARKSGFKETPLPIINFVKAVKITQ